MMERDPKPQVISEIRNNEVAKHREGNVANRLPAQHNHAIPSTLQLPRPSALLR